MRNGFASAMRAMALLGVLAMTWSGCPAAQLKTETSQAFDRYVRSQEAQMDREVASEQGFLWIDRLPEEPRSQSYAELKRGDVVVQSAEGSRGTDGIYVPGGLIHDWVGIAFVPGVSLAQTLAMLQDYNRDSEYYRPEVLRSELRSRSGNDFRVYLRIERTHIVTIVFDTEYDTRYFSLDALRAYSRSYSTRIAEVEHAGQPRERAMSPGDDHGYLWRLYSYWRFYQADGGTYVQCEAVSLTRAVPVGLGWMVAPFIRSVPGESLRFTLESTRNALKKLWATPASAAGLADAAAVAN